jgi:hypothetical protein
MITTDTKKSMCIDGRRNRRIVPQQQEDTTHNHAFDYSNITTINTN